MKLKETCTCGASIEIHDPRETFINRGGKPDADGYIFQSELLLERWRNFHHEPKEATDGKA